MTKGWNVKAEMCRTLRPRRKRGGIPTVQTRAPSVVSGSSISLALDFQLSPPAFLKRRGQSFWASPVLCRCLSLNRQSWLEWRRFGRPLGDITAATGELAPRPSRCDSAVFWFPYVVLSIRCISASFHLTQQKNLFVPRVTNWNVTRCLETSFSFHTNARRSSRPRAPGSSRNVLKNSLEGSGVGWPYRLPPAAARSITPTAAGALHGDASGPAWSPRAC